MKRIIFLLASTGILLFSSTTALWGQSDNRVVITTSDGKDVINISSGSDGEDLVIRIASMEIAMNGHKSAAKSGSRVTYSAARPLRVAFGSSNFQSFFELGFNTLPCPDYSMYGNLAGTVYDFLDLRNAKSLQFAFSLGDLTLYLNRQRSLAFTTAFQIVFDEYVFSNNITLVKKDGILVPASISPSYKKSKLSTTSFQIPLIFTIGRSRSFHFSLGVYGGVRIGNHTKIKFPKTKMYDMYMAPFYGGITARAGFRGLYVYTNYALSDMFKRGKGPAVAPLTVGMGLGF